MNDYTITVEAIKETPTYKELLKRKEHIKAKFLEQLDMRKAMTNAVEIWKDKGEIPKHFTGAYLSCINDLIEDYKQNKGIDASNIMTAERITLTDNTIIE